MNKEITSEKYKLLKEKGYKLAAELSEKNFDKETFDQIVEEEKAKINNEDAKVIFEHTVKYPNDAELYWELKDQDKNTGNKNSYKSPNILSKLNWPFDVAFNKMQEVSKYDLRGLLESNPELMRLATQAPYYEIRCGEENIPNKNKV